MRITHREFDRLRFTSNFVKIKIQRDIEYRLQNTEYRQKENEKECSIFSVHKEMRIFPFIHYMCYMLQAPTHKT